MFFFIWNIDEKNMCGNKLDFFKNTKHILKETVENHCYKNKNIGKTTKNNSK